MYIKIKTFKNYDGYVSALQTLRIITKISVINWFMKPQK